MKDIIEGITPTEVYPEKSDKETFEVLGLVVSIWVISELFCHVLKGVTTPNTPYGVGSRSFVVA